MVSGNYFEVLGLDVRAGTTVTAATITAKEANPVVVLGYDYWRTRLAAHRDVVGQSVLINGHPFHGPRRRAAQLPLCDRLPSGSLRPHQHELQSPFRGWRRAMTLPVAGRCGSLLWLGSNRGVEAQAERVLRRFGSRFARRN